MNGKVPEKTDVDLSSDLLNPFVHRLELATTYDKIKTGLFTVAVLPFRVAAIIVLLVLAWLLACVGLFGLSDDDLRNKPMTGWRKKIRLAICRIGNWSYAAGGMTITVRGRQATRSEAPILVVAPHSTFLDAGIVYVTGYPSIIVRRESGNNPWLGKLINLTQPVYVWREDPNSRQRSIREIISRATSPHDWPQVLIFPEGTCTNRSCLITFKPGAFYPGVPVQPVCIRYPNKTDTVTWTWEGPGALKLLWLTLTQAHSNCEIEFLPVYRPSEEEKRDPKLFANNVRDVMAKALGVPVSDFTYNDCRLISLVKQMKVPRSTCLLEVQRLRAKLGLTHKGVEERLASSSSSSIRSRWPTLTLPEFASSLEVPAEEAALSIMFNLYSDDGAGVIDFREYLMGVLAVEHNCAPADALRIAWQVYDSSGSGRLSARDFSEALHASMATSCEDAHDAFRTLDAAGRGYVTFDELEAYAFRRPEFAHVFPASSAASSSSATAPSKERAVPCARLDSTKEKAL